MTKEDLIKELKKRDMSTSDIMDFLSMSHTEKTRSKIKSIIENLTNEVLLYEYDKKEGKLNTIVYGILPKE